MKSSFDLLGRAALHVIMLHMLILVIAFAIDAPVILKPADSFWLLTVLQLSFMASVFWYLLFRLTGMLLMSL